LHFPLFSEGHLESKFNLKFFTDCHLNIETSQLLIIQRYSLIYDLNDLRMHISSTPMFDEDYTNIRLVDLDAYRILSQILIIYVEEESFTQ